MIGPIPVVSVGTLFRPGNLVKVSMTGGTDARIKNEEKDNSIKLESPSGGQTGNISLTPAKPMANNNPTKINKQ